VKIWLIRHAKSSWSNPGQSDFDRPLNNRGERDGPRMARWLAEQDCPATWIWSSDAARALATAEFVRQGFSLGEGLPVAAPELYLASPETMIDVITRTPDEIKSVAVVAHNPGTTYLLNLLTGSAVTDNVPTFGIARLQFSGSWLEFRAGACRLDLFTAPKLLSAT
jgi:phosphohistidine phosphatase